MSKVQTKNLLFLISTSLLFIFSLVLVAMSFSVADDSFGTEFGTNSDYAIILLISGVAFIYSLLVFLNKTNEKSGPIAMLVMFSIGSLYSLSVFIKAMVKGKPFMDYQLYLYIGIVALAFLTYSILLYLLKNEK